MVLPVYDVQKKLLFLWFQLQQQAPELFPTNDMLPVVSGFFSILRDPELRDDQDDPHTPTFPASCSIWPSRPNVCRVFPLGRVMNIEMDLNDSYDPSSLVVTQQKQRVILKDDTCPLKAFQQGKQKSAAQFLHEQEVEQMESTAIFTQVATFLAQHAKLLEEQPADQVEFFYMALIQKMYYGTEYTPDAKKFYHQLHTQLTEFINHFNTGWHKFFIFWKVHGRLPSSEELNS